MSFDDRGFMRNQSRYKTETSSREAHCQTGCNQYEKKPVMSGLLYEALFSTGESSQAPGETSFTFYRMIDTETNYKLFNA